MLQGLNHLTLAVTDLRVSLAFYQRLAACRKNPYAKMIFK
jgi:catechol 2,3-dioxygenase-like lactoylglutathione lyase family enzyme